MSWMLQFTEHALLISSETEEVDLKNFLDPILNASTKFEARRIKRSQNTGVWLAAMPSTTAYGTALSMDEFRDSLRLQFGLTPLGIPKTCDGCP